MKITMVAAAAENNALGKNNDLVWHLPDDFKRFKAITSHHHIVLGRKTFESFPKLLPNRKHIVITRQTDYKREGIEVVHSLEEALQSCAGEEEVFIIGGGEIYKQAMPYADKIELTRVHASFEADAFFPEIDESKWKLVNKEVHKQDERHKYDFSYLTYLKTT
ncbi:dihydrofolate reductase [Psychroflexus montanilacus]|uniref:dihydrofolate reductase n=1 Tax=Psychroflexus montanilacus TaxID=2873598 RepID=UPI001CCD5640|nr:dihydrofolate reductase [Psychroflexus montanilacus]MBZ9651994.1 dihydrofolate reductase [Psychroflexus montanilacus]